MKTWKEFTFEDGYRVECYGFSRQELAVEERKHGKVVSVRIV